MTALGPLQELEDFFNTIFAQCQIRWHPVTQYFYTIFAQGQIRALLAPCYELFLTPLGPLQELEESAR